MKSRVIRKIKPNGMPAFAGMTSLMEIACKKNRHAREGGHPIFFDFSNPGRIT